MRYAHLAFGLGLFIVFTITGSYMRVDFPDKDAISQELRVLMRARHIYTLFSALIHMALGFTSPCGHGFCSACCRSAVH
jgi:hypothetical protein